MYLGSINSYLDVILESFIQKDIFESVDTILLLGYDMTEHYPNAWNHGDNKKIININYFDNETNKSFISDIKNNRKHHRNTSEDCQKDKTTD